MYKFLSIISKAIIPIAIILFSVLTMLPEANIHTEVLRNDNFYSKISTEVKKNVYLLNDENLAKIGTGFPAREVIKDNPALTKLYTEAIPKEQIEVTIRDIIDSQFRNIENTFKNNVTILNDDTISRIQNFAVSLYQFRLLLIAGIIVLMLFVLISAIFTNNRHFALIAKFYASLSTGLTTLLLFTILGLVGWSFLGNLSRQGMNKFLDTNYYGIELLDIVNWQWAKFIVYLLIPAIGFLALTLFLTVAFGFLSLFQRESAEEKEVKISLTNRPVYEKISNLEAMNSATIDNRITSYVDENNYDSEGRALPKKNIFKPITNTPFPIPEPKTRESLDPFLDRLSASIAEDGTLIDDGKIKIKK